MAFSKFKYVGDDGITYQMSLHPERCAPLAGNLPAAAGGEPVFPALSQPRFMFAIPLAPATGDPLMVVCDGFNAPFTTGPGAVIVISSVSYLVQQCLGESKQIGS